MFETWMDSIRFAIGYKKTAFKIYWAIRAIIESLEKKKISKAKII